jgi:hypothetical protein
MQPHVVPQPTWWPPMLACGCLGSATTRVTVRLSNTPAGAEPLVEAPPVSAAGLAPGGSGPP